MQAGLLDRFLFEFYSVLSKQTVLSDTSGPIFMSARNSIWSIINRVVCFLIRALSLWIVCVDF